MTTNTNNLPSMSNFEIREVLDTYEGMIRQIPPEEFNGARGADLRKRWCELKAQAIAQGAL